jgi:hypothetical protein
MGHIKCLNQHGITVYVNGCAQFDKKTLALSYLALSVGIGPIECNITPSGNEDP